MTHHKDAKEAREFFINPEIGDIRFQEPDRFKSTYIKVREVMPESPCENCNKVHKSNNLTYFTCQAQVEDILYHTSRELEEAKTEITRLKKQLEMCKEVLAYYANKNNWDEPRQQTTGIIQLSKINQSDFEDTGNGEGYYIAGKRARECLAKLEKE